MPKEEGENVLQPYMPPSTTATAKQRKSKSKVKTKTKAQTKTKENLQNPAATEAPEKKQEGGKGRWADEEGAAFEEGMKLHPRNWPQTAILFKTRTKMQCRTHAQKATKDLYNTRGGPGQSAKALALFHVPVHLPNAPSTVP
jgi:hypothetical protein